jgi:hypothetical protein
MRDPKKTQTRPNKTVSYSFHLQNISVSIRDPEKTGLGWVHFRSHLGPVCETGKRPKIDLFATSGRMIIRDIFFRLGFFGTQTRPF